MCDEGKSDAELETWAKTISTGASNQFLETEWKDAFEELGKHDYCRKLQLEARAQYIERAINNFCSSYGLNTVRGFVMALNVTETEWGMSDYYQTITNQFTEGMSDRDKLKIIMKYGNHKSRKEAIANGSGVVNGEMFNLDAGFGLNDKIIVDLTAS